MKKQLIIFGILIAGFIVYHLFFQVEDGKTDAVISILYTSVLFGYIAYMAYCLLKKMKKQ
ncbi:hypothetical protein BCF50_2370 [Chryseobacterium daecheongense]|uniref:Uncharacterized protein n=1 Tax=Chryseobacterium daecheongense TaxID=192389 RepID=A0A3N0VXD1_9FLAO|nr:hypothetical protein EGI05_08660 [Chryseobacterium daecheongense]TDX93392.1 hypothetical protein BCF50_2370 [Chryseobacterium daecheongense]